MRTIATILICPSEGDPLGLVKDGLYGSRPPTLRHPAAGWDRHLPCNGTGIIEDPHSEYLTINCGCENGVQARQALILARKGEEVREGMDRLDWAQHRGPLGTKPSRTRQANYDPPAPKGLPENLYQCWHQAWLACHGAEHIGQSGVGTIVLLDEDDLQVLG